MKRIGLTGGVGMGKSTFAQALLQSAVPVIDTDAISRSLSAPGGAAYPEIVARFGPAILKASGEIDRARLASIVFAQRESRRDLEKILHPRIREKWVAQLDDWRRAGRAAGCVIIPLLFETEAARHFDATICIACAAETQRARLRHRGWSDEQIDRRNGAQLPIAEKIEAADYVVWAEGKPELLKQQWERIARDLALIR